MFKHLLIFLACLSVVPAFADDRAQANRLLVEAAKMIKAAETVEGPEEKLSLLEDALAKLNEIIERHPSTDLAVKLITEQPIGSLSHVWLSNVVKILRAERSVQQQEEIDEDAKQPLEETAVQFYLALVFQEIERHKRYPRFAERSGLDGRVVLRFTVRSDGEVLNPEVVEVAGHGSFGKAALQALARVGMLPPFPDTIRRRELLVEVPLTFNLDAR